MSDAEKIMLIKSKLSEVFDTRTENTETDKACRNLARCIQVIIEPDAEITFEN